MTNGRHPWRMPVAPVPDATRPRWSVMIPAYNCGRFIAETLESVLAQDQGEGLMQIEVVDDCSTDDTAAVVRSAGAARVGYYRQPRNQGHIGNFQTCLERARGEFVHLLHGDDLVRPLFYEALEDGFARAPEAGAAFCRSVYIDDGSDEVGAVEPEQPKAGLLPDALARLATEQRIMTPSIAVRRSVYEALGGFDKRLACAEDWEMWVRIAAHFAIWYEPRALAAYRMHGNSNTGRHVRAAQDAAYNRKAISIFKDYLPPQRAEEISGAARKIYARSAAETGRSFVKAGEWSAAAAQFRQAMLLHPSPSTVGAIARAFAEARFGHAR